MRFTSRPVRTLQACAKVRAFQSFAFGLCLLSTAFSLSVLAQTGDTFPSLLTETLSGSEIEIPQSLQGRYALLGFAQTKAAEGDLRSWQLPLHRKFVQKAGFMDQSFDLQLYFIPVFTGLQKASKTKIVKELKKNNEKEVEEHLLIYSGARGDLELLKMSDKKKPYFYLLDAQGLIVWSGVGAFRQKHLDEIEALLLED